MKIKDNIIVIRHSIREPITDARDSYRQKITKEGIKLANILGQKIANNSNNFAFFHSPVPRCKETAIAIIKGIETNKTIENNVKQLDALDGFFYKNWEYCANLMNKQHFTKKWFKNEIPEKYIMPIELAAKKMLSEISNNSKENFLNIFITHDWNLFCLKSLYYKEYREIKVPQYLEGISISKNLQSIQIIKKEDYTD